MRKTKLIWLLFFSILLLVACEGEEEVEEVVEEPFLSITEEEIAEGWRYIPELGMKMKIPNAWFEPESAIFSYYERQGPVKSWTWSYIPFDKFEVYQKMNPDFVPLRDTALQQRVEEGFFPFLRPIIQYSIVDKTEIGEEERPKKYLEGDTIQTLEETEKYLYAISRWDSYQMSGMSEGSQEAYLTYIQNADEIKDQVETGRVLTDEEYFLFLEPLTFTSLTAEGDEITEQVFQNHRYSIVMLWSGTREGCRRDWDIWRELSPWMEEENIGFYGVVLPSRKASQWDLVTPNHLDFTQIIANEPWKGIANHVRYVPTYLLVDDQGRILRVPDNRGSAEKWQLWLEKTLEELETDNQEV